MAYKSLMSFMSDAELGRSVLKHVAAQSDLWDAHADVLCLGIDRSQAGYYYAGANALLVQESMSRAQADAAEIKSQIMPEFDRLGIRGGVDSGVAQLADLGRAVALRSRFSDLVVLPRPYGEGRGVEAEVMVEAAMFEGGVPVLVVPEETDPMGQPETILLAWNESDEALAAARHALPFLKGAQNVRLVVIDPDPHSPERSDPGGMLAQMLSRHGARCEIDVLGRSLPRISDILARHVMDTNADMLVMGAYGHSRLREALIGGATRDMLEAIPVPVLMAH